MGRAITQPGRNTPIKRKRLKDKDGNEIKGRWVAWCRYAGDDGVVRRAKRYSPDGVRDPHGAKAVAALEDALPDLKASSGAAPRQKVDEETLVDLLRVELSKIRKSPEYYSRRTVDSYTRVERVMVSSVLDDEDKPNVCREGGHDHLGVVKDTPAKLVTAADLKAVIFDIESGHDRVTASQARTLLRLVGSYLVDSGVWTVNLASAVEFRRRRHAKGAAMGLGRDEALELMSALRTSEAELPPSKSGTRATGRTVSEFAATVDLVDPLMMTLWTGLRRSEVLALLWSDVDFEAQALTVRHHIVRAYQHHGEGEGPKTELLHEAATKTENSARVIPLADEVVEMLQRRRREYMTGERVAPRVGVEPVIFPTTVGGLRDPDTFASQWTRIRGALGVPWLTLHRLRKSTARILHDAGFTSRQIADLLGHAQISMTEDTYIGRGSGPSREVAAGLSAALGSATK
ncbi:putative recombinase [Gordonia namibiensis NBRC 108229]|uniref:Putative recombinase n=1 Tax=Gordonia namibiensis NBRC 108229 TaxID=1208314 RepID=K6X383_9ACTN|nr:site-specific integrase [Gordonia namibiensis]GAC00537.1 putative recombinase [Gordonia namibiensis NBRC 108229]